MEFVTNAYIFNQTTRKAIASKLSRNSEQERTRLITEDKMQIQPKLSKQKW